MSDNTHPKMLTVPEAAERLSVSEATLRRWIRDGHLQAHQWKAHGAIRVDPDDLRPRMSWMSVS